MYNDSTYQELKAYYEKTTIFNVLGVERSETRHSAFLCWLLNANASHGLGEEPTYSCSRRTIQKKCFLTYFFLQCLNSGCKITMF